jgi:FtsZ-binding cell division protein ZapB
MLKKIALAFPPIRRLYQERAKLADERRALRRERDELRERNKQLRGRDPASWPQELSIVIDRADNAHPMAALADEALAIALAGQGALPPEVLAIEGMSGRKYRRFINAFVARMTDARYLEIGVHKGSTACAAIYGNAVAATLIDDWSLFGGDQTRLECEDNLARFSPKDIELKMISQDFRAVAPESLGRFNIYFFDGPHSDVEQYDGVSLMQPALDEAYLLVVDDWNWPQVRAGTLAALRDLKAKLDYRLEVRTTSDDSHPVIARGRSDWHNGYFIAVVRKEAGA